MKTENKIHCIVCSKELDNLVRVSKMAKKVDYKYG